MDHFKDFNLIIWTWFWSKSTLDKGIQDWSQI